MKKEKNIKNNKNIKKIIIPILVVIAILVFSFLIQKQDTVTITLNIDESNSYELDEIKKGEKVAEPEEPEKEGYTFVGWYLDDEKFDFSTEIIEDVTLDAKWAINEYSVTIKTGNGNIVDIKVNHDGTIDVPQTPTRTGYTFVGWYVDGEKFDFNTKITSNLTLEAKWTQNQYTSYRVEHYLMDRNGNYNSVPNETETFTGKINSTVSPKINEYKGYTSPSIQSINVSADGSSVVKYYYSINKYTLTIIGDAGVKEVTGNGIYFYNDEIEINYVLMPEYVFSSYSEKVNGNIYTMPDHDVTIMINTYSSTSIEYKVEHYKMDLNGNYSDTPNEVEKLTGLTSTTVTPEVKAYSGFTSPEKQELELTEDGNLVLKYYYERNKYTLSIENNNSIDTVIGSGEYYFEEEVKISATIKDGYIFKKWSNGQRALEFTYIVPAKDETLKVISLVNNYTLEYNLNGGTLSEENPGVYTVETEDFTLNNPTKGGYVFIGWSLNNEEPVQNLTIKKGTIGNLNLEAIFEEATNTEYKVEHYKMDLNGNYSNTPDEAEILTGKTNSKVLVDVKTYDNFISPEKQEIVIEADGSSVLKYYYERSKYTLTIQGDKGVENVLGTGTYYFEQEVNVSATLKEGYELNNWSNDATDLEFTHKITQNQTLTLQTKLINYNITYNLNDGILNEDNITEYTVETEDFTLNNPTKVGYTFIGWSLNNEEPVQNLTIKKGITGNLNIEAIFEANKDTKYKVEHYKMDSNGNYSNTPDEVETLTGTTDTKVLVDVKTYDNFISPEKQEIIVQADGSAVLKYYYERCKYTLTIVTDSGIEKVVGSGTYYFEQEVKVSATLKEGYSFKEWLKDNISYSNQEQITVTINNNVTLKATTEPNIYKITFDTNGGTEIEESNVYYGTIVSKPTNPTKLGHTFVGWYTEEELINEFDFNTTMPAYDFTLYAKWEANPYAIMFDSNGGTKVESIVQEYGTIVSRPENPTKEGYTFDNWYTDETFTQIYEFTTMPEYGITVYANWTPNEYTILFDANGGVGEILKQTFTYDASAYLNANTFSKEGYTFIGWSEKPNGEVIYTDKQEVKNIISNGSKTLYAKWDLVTYTINYNLNNGILSKENITEYTVETEDFTLNNPTKVGYTFIGWSLNNEEPVQSLTIQKGTTGNLNLEAIFEEGTSTEYKVEHYKMDLNGNYSNTPDEVETLTGRTNSKVLPQTKTYEGFISPEKQEIVIEADGSSVLKYYYERSKYTLTIQGDKGVEKVFGAGSYYFEQEVKVSATLKEGYELNNWSNDATTLEFTHKITQNQTLTLQTKLINYNITYNLNNGILSKDNITEYTVETENFTLNNPTKLGYTFIGWSLNNGEPVKELTITTGTTGNLNIEAIFEANKDTEYKVEHYKMDANGNYSNTPDEVETLTGTTDTKVLVDVKTYDNFISPEKQEIVIEADGSSILKYYYERSKYTLTIQGDKGVENVLGTGSYYFEQEVNVSSTLKEGYELDNWSNGITELEFTHKMNSKNETLTLQTKLINYNITYNLNDGILSEDNITEYTVETENFTLNNPTKVGYTFIGWSLNNEEPVQNLTIKKGTTGNLNIEAIFEANNYQIKYNGNGNTSGSMSNSNHKYDTSSTLSPNSFIKDYVITYDYNYDNVKEDVNVANIFNGWSLTLNGEIKYTDEQSIFNLTTKNGEVINLYANWEDPTITLKTPTREGYLFTGWSTTSNGNNIISSENYNLTGNVTLYATWKLIPAFEALSFDLYKDENAKELYPSEDTFSKGDKAFYIKLPNDGYLDINSVSFSLNTPITLNTEAISSSNYIDLIPTDSNRISLTSYSVNVKTIDDGTTWIGASTQKNLLGVKLFLQVLGSQYSGKNIGIAENFGLSSEGVGTEHYVSTRTTIGSNTFMFFAKEGTKYITLTFVNGDNTIVTVSVPKGSTAPNIGEYKISGYDFVNWYSDSDFTSTYDFTQPLYENTTIYGKYEQGDIDIDWYDSVSTTYDICTNKELKGFAALSSNGTNFSGKTVNLTCDINLNNEEWTPISSFKGTFNGNNNTISNLKITTSTGSVGFFSSLGSNTTISNLKFEGVQITNTASANTGTVAGSSSGTRIDRISVNNVTINGQERAAGIIGSASTGTIINECSVTNGSIDVTSTDVGGIVASASGTITLTNLYSNVSVSSDSIAAPDAGGILGNYSNATNELIMKNVLFTGEVSHSAWVYTSAGAIYGRIGLSKTGNDSFSDDKEGNKINWFYDSSKIGLTGNTYLKRGTSKTTEELKTASTYSDWDTDIWNIIDGSYPTLNWMK